MVDELVKKEEGPYRKKLLDLAQHSINNGKKKDPKEQFTSAGVVDTAWQSVEYYWANPSSDERLAGDACAFTSMGKDHDDEHFPVIGISSSFKENDSEQRQPDRPAAVTTDGMTADDKKTLLLFFKKIKHEFLNVVHRYLAIRYEKEFREVGAPEKYTPTKQSKKGEKLDPKVGDHDEEEDSGGPILPLKFNQKLSTENPLCLYLNGGYLQLTDTIVEGLLRLEIYSLPVDEGPHPGGFFGINDCRAVKRGVFDSNFYRGNPIASDYRRGSSVRAVSSKSSSASSSRSSSPANCSRASSPAYGSRASSPANDSRASSLAYGSRASSPANGSEADDATQLAAWRRLGHIPIQFPGIYTPSQQGENASS